MKKNEKKPRVFFIFGGLNLHWQTSFGRNQQKPRQMKKKTKKNLEFFSFLEVWTFTGKPHLDETSKNRGKWKKNEKKIKKNGKNEKKKKNEKHLEFFFIFGGLNLHWQTSFGRNQQKPRQMKKKTKK